MSDKKRKMEGNRTLDVLGQMETLPVFAIGSSKFIPPNTLAKGGREESGFTTIRKQLLLLKPVIGVPRLH